MPAKIIDRKIDRKKMTEANSSDLMVREPTSAEVARAIHLFRDSRMPLQARVFVVVKTHPIERFIAAMAWWPQATIICFRLAAQPGATLRAEACGLLIDHLSECSRVFGIKTIHYGDLLADDNEWGAILKRHGFTCLRSERFFEVSTQQAWTRIMELFEKHGNRIPATWRTESIRHHAPESILAFVEPYRLMPPEEIRERWRADCPSGFELDLSSILFDGTLPIGISLLRHVQDTLCVDVRVVQAENRLLNSLGNAALLHHTAKLHGPVGIARRLQFRGGEVEHRETANLALRMGGRELPSRHVFSKVISLSSGLGEMWQL
jgi:hypothetical protein